MSNQFNRVLVTGGAGYVGSALVPELLDRGMEVTVLDRFLFGEDALVEHRRLKLIKGDIRDPEAVSAALSDVDAVIHLACISNDPGVEMNPKEGREVNLDAFEPLVVDAGEAGVQRFIYASSSSVYGVKPDGMTVTEDLPLEPLTDYARYKADCEGVLASYRGHGMSTVVVRPAALCGFAPRLRLDLVVNLFVAQALTLGYIKVLGGSQRRALLHVDDMALCYIDLLSAPDSMIDGKVWNVGAANMTVMEIAEAVRKRTGATIMLGELGDDQRSYSISSQAIACDLGFVPTLDVDDAIDELILAWSHGLFPADALSNPAYVNVLRYKELMA